jgi:aspartate oxidase
MSIQQDDIDSTAQRSAGNPRLQIAIIGSGAATMAAALKAAPGSP